MSRSIKYLFKYIHKGVDYVVGLLKEKGASKNEIDEIKKYLEMRYISTTEACWRLFQFDLHYQDPAIEAKFPSRRRATSYFSRLGETGTNSQKRRD